jgi:oligopeptide/dipeptide ABC transporter ATP-binding protein
MLEFIERAKKALIYSHKESLNNTKTALESIDNLKEALSKEEIDEKLVKELFKISAINTQESIDKLDIYRSSLAYTYGSSVSALLKKFFNADKVNSKLQSTYDKQKKQYDAIIAKGKTPNWNLIPIELLDKKEILNDIIGHINFIEESLVKYVNDVDVDYDKRAVDLIDFYKQKASNIVNKVTKRSAKTKAIKLMQEVGIPEPYKRFRQYPFEFSGGMRQRIVIAIALAADPEILICDEPTTALDVTIQSQILELINKLKVERNLSIIFITHDMGVVANMADEISVMYAGKIVEYGTSEDIFYDPRHPYTWALLSSMPDLDTKEKLESIPGTPPNMIYPPKGDAFAERNKFAMKIDFEQQPPMFKVSDTHYAATWLLHPNAPKVEMPKLLKDRIEKMKKAAVTEDE